MKYLKNSIVLIVLMLLFSCSAEDSTIIKEDNAKELALKLENDKDINQIISKNAEFSLLFMEKLKQNDFSTKYSSIDEIDIEEVMTEMNFKVFYDDYIKEINQHIFNINVKYPNISTISEKDIKLIFDKHLKSNKFNNANYKMSTDCDAQFQSDMQTIHDNYDASVSICTVATFLSGGLASPCYVYAVTKATFESAVAIDRHTLCTQK